LPIDHLAPRILRADAVPPRPSMLHLVIGAVSRPVLRLAFRLLERAVGAAPHGGAPA
jgi:hypothetical protein